MTINYIWIISAFLIPSLIVTITRFTIIFNLKKGKAKISQIETQKLNLAIANLRLDYNAKSFYQQYLLIILLITFTMFLGFFGGAYSTESFTLNPFYHGHSFFYGLMALFFCVTFQMYSFYCAKQNDKIWQTSAGRNFIDNHPELLVSSHKQKFVLYIVRLIAITISIFNLLYFYFNA